MDFDCAGRRGISGRSLPLIISFFAKHETRRPHAPAGFFRFQHWHAHKCAQGTAPQAGMRAAGSCR